MNAKTRKVGNPLALAVLAYLMQRPMHPYEIGKLLVERKQHESIKFRNGSLYMVVEQLRRDDFITVHEIERDGQLPTRTIYRLTDSGRAELRERMRELIASPRKEFRAFEGALSLVVVLPPDEVGELLARRQAALGDAAGRIREHLASSPAAAIDRLFLTEHEYRLELIEAEQRFVDRFRALIAEGADDFGGFWRRFHAQSDG